MLKLTLPNGTIKEYPEGITLLEVSRELNGFYSQPVVEGIFNGVGTDLQKPLYSDGIVDFITWDTEEGRRVYVRSLLFLFLYAIKTLRPEVQLEVCNSIGSALYCDITNGIVLSKYDLRDIDLFMRKLIAAQEPIVYSTISRAEAEKILVERREDDRLQLLGNTPGAQTLTVYKLRDYMEYFFGAMMPDCSYLKQFELINYENGIIINYPDKCCMDRLDKFEPSDALNGMFHELQDWSAKINCNTVAKLNRIISCGYANGIIQVAEALHEKKIAGIADKIAASNKDVRLVLIAGPSSSGKTTFAQRLSIQMVVNGLRPVPVSMDDYFKDRHDTPRKPDGTFDFESVDAVDLELFNDHLRRLLAGECVKMPKYNFRSGMREYRGREIQLGENDVLVVEGIHALNERISEAVPANNKMKIYISALTPMQLDSYNRIHTTDMRLLRRIVRDSQFRSHDALMTLKLWDNVRRGEEQYVFPFQDSADIMFNTSLVYEFAVLKKYAEPLLKLIQPDEAVYTRAQRLLELLSHVRGMDDAAIPTNSILREFIGGSIFKEAL